MYCSCSLQTASRNAPNPTIRKSVKRQPPCHQLSFDRALPRHALRAKTKKRLRHQPSGRRLMPALRKRTPSLPKTGFSPDFALLHNPLRPSPRQTPTSSGGRLPAQETPSPTRRSRANSSPAKNLSHLYRQHPAASPTRTQRRQQLSRAAGRRPPPPNPAPKPDRIRQRLPGSAPPKPEPPPPPAQSAASPAAAAPAPARSATAPPRRPG